MKLIKHAMVRLRRPGDAEWAEGVVIAASENGRCVIVDLGDGGIHAGGGFMFGTVPLVVDPEQQTVHELMTGTPIEMEVADHIARFDIPRDKFPVLLEALHPQTGAVVWSERVEAPRAIAIPPLAHDLGHSVALRITYADGRVEETPAPTLPTTVQ